MLRLLTVLLPCALLLRALPVPATGAAWLVVDEPSEPRSRSALSLIEVQGHAGARRGTGHDLVIVLDVSDSTLQDSGVDLDEDGPEGRSDRGVLLWLENQVDRPDLLRTLREEQDFEDTILNAELLAAQALIERLDPRRFRVGLVTFSDIARVRADLGADRETLLHELRAIRRDFYADLHGTNFAAAIEKAHGLLRPAEGVPEDGRVRSIVFLSDGAPTLPVQGDRAERFAVSAAMAAGEDGVRLYAFAIGEEAEEALIVLRKMAAWTNGHLEALEQPGHVVARLRHLDLVDLAEVRIRNATTGGEGRAVRTFPDGSFDGFVELRPGANRIRFDAKSLDGTTHQAERIVTLDANGVASVATGPAGESGSDEPDEAVMLERLAERTRELELLRTIEETRRQRREVEIDVER